MLSLLWEITHNLGLADICEKTKFSIPFIIFVPDSKKTKST